MFCSLWCQKVINVFSDPVGITGTVRNIRTTQWNFVLDSPSICQDLLEFLAKCLIFSVWDFQVLKGIQTVFGYGMFASQIL